MQTVLTLTIFLAAFFTAFCLAVVAVRSVRLKRVTLLDWCLLGMAGVYGVGWALVAYVTHQGGNPLWEAWLVPNERIYPLHTLSAFPLVGGIWLGWMLVGTLNSVRRPPTPRVIPCQARLTLVAWVLWLMAFVAQWLYSGAYGGFVGLLDYAALIRSGIFPIKNPWSFLRPFGGLALVASFVFYGLWLSRYRTLAVRAGLMLSVLFSLYILYSWLGRMSFLVYIVTFLLGPSILANTRPYALWIKGVFAMTTTLILAYFLSVALNLKAADNLTMFLARELSFPFVSFFAHLSSRQITYRWFYDLVVAPVFLLPSSVWTRWVENISQVNTALIMGAPKGEQGVTGSIPVDLLTLGLLQASIPGIVLVGVAFGGLLRATERFIRFIPDPGVRACLEAYVALKVAVLNVHYAEPALLVGGNFHLILAAFLVVVATKMPRISLRAPTP